MTELPASRCIVATRDGEMRESTANFLEALLGLVQISLKKELDNHDMGGSFG